MLRTVVAAIALLAFLASAGMASAAGLRMMSPGVESVELFARMLEVSLEKDPSGNSVLQNSQCTTPRHFYDAIVKMHPDVKLDADPETGLRELPAYVRQLERRSNPGGTEIYKMSRILHRVGADGTDQCKLDIEGWTREFRNGEFAFWDVNLNRPILAGDCTNVVGPKADQSVGSKPAPPPMPTSAPARPAIVVPPAGGKTLVYTIFPQAIEGAVDGIRELQAKALASASFRGERVSRNKCGEMRHQAANQGGVLPSTRSHPVKITAIKVDGEKVVEEMGLYTAIVQGFVHIPIPKKAEDFGWDAIRIIHYDPARTPATFTGTGFAETRFFRDEWDPLEHVMNACAVEYETTLVAIKD